MNYTFMFVLILLVFSMSCSPKEILKLSDPNSDKIITVVDKRKTRFVFLSEINSLEEGLEAENVFIKLQTSETTILSDAIFVCWGTEGKPVEVFCPNTTVLMRSSASEKLVFSFTDPEFAGQKFHSSGCFEYGYETGNIFPKGRARIER